MLASRFFGSCVSEPTRERKEKRREKAEARVGSREHAHACDARPRCPPAGYRPNPAERTKFVKTAFNRTTTFDKANKFF